MRFHLILQFQSELGQLVAKYMGLGLGADELHQPAADSIERMTLGQAAVPPLTAEEAEELARSYEEVNRK